MSAEQLFMSSSHPSEVTFAAALVLVMSLGGWGCKRLSDESHTPELQSVTVSTPVQREVTEYAEFTARIAAVDTVEVRARVWGYIEKVHFKEGALVQKGEVLIEIDPRTYEAELAQAQANIAQAQAQRDDIEIDFHRIQSVFAKGAASAQEADQIAANLAEAEARVAAAKAACELTRLNLGFTKITSPIAGRVGRAMVTQGNLIQSGQVGGTTLTTIVSVDPMYAYFDADERTVLRVKQLVRQGKLGMPDEVEILVWLGLANEEGYPHRGIVDFVDNQVNPRTGTLRVRGVFRNTQEVLTPGYFARVRVPVSAPHQALLVTERALDTDQGQRVLYVVDREDRVTIRPVRLGAMHEGLREITQGLNAGEQVIVTGVQLVRPGAVVKPRLVDMSTLLSDPSGDTTTRVDVVSSH